MLIPVEEAFRPYLDAALTRLRYLYPNVTFTPSATGIDAVGHSDTDSEALVRDVQHALYREKIYAETLPMRRALVDTVTRR